MAIKLPFRQIHLDFHTGPAIDDVGQDFDAQAFAKMMAKAHVNSVTLFAKCHHGHLYYDTKRPERHPGLKKGLDLLGQQIEALHRQGIQAPIYLSVLCDEYAANTRPEWLARQPDSSSVKWAKGVFEPGWQILDMSSPYADFLAEQIEEVLRKYRPVDGVFLDMCWDQPSCSTWAIAGMRRAGLNPELEADRATYARQVVHGYMTRYNRLIKRVCGGQSPKVWYNARPQVNLPQEAKYLQHIEIEALPTGGWGYTYFPLNVRFARNFGLPAIGVTARFHKSWADFGGLKPAAALKYECSQMLAHGTGCSVGDQLHPRGRLDPAAYELIGGVYAHVEACEPFCAEARPVTQIGVLRPLDLGSYHVAPGDCLEGVVRALQQLHHQFDFIHAGSDFSSYELIVVPESVQMDGPLAGKIRTYLKAGGAVFFALGAEAPGAVLLPEQGVAAHGPSPFTTTYLRFADPAAAGVARTDHVMYERGLRLTPKAGASVLCRVVEPYFERRWDHFSSHNQTPADRLSKYAAVVAKGRVVTCAFPVFKAYATHGNLPYRALIQVCLDRLLPAALTRFDGPSHVELTVTRQKRPARTMVHVLSYIPARRTPKLDIVEEATPLVNGQLALRLPKAPRRVTVQPAGREVPFTYVDGYAHLSLTSDHGHDMVVFEG